MLAGTYSCWSEPGTASELQMPSNWPHTTLSAISPRPFARPLATTREVLVSADNLALASEPFYLLILQDITDRVRLENELRQAQKMEAVGRLAAGVAHDFNNMLTVILGYASMMQNGTPRLDAKLASYLRQVEQAAERATALTRQLLAYSRKQMIQRRPLQLNEIVNQTASMLRRSIGEHITLDMQLTPDLPLVFADTSERRSGHHESRAQLPRCHARWRQAYPLLRQPSRSMRPTAGTLPMPRSAASSALTVKDSGHGMDAATLSRIFEPFFTTKEPGKGTGMGMATVYGVLKQHKGWIEVESAPRRGTIMRAFLPVSEAYEDALAESPPRRPIPRRQSAPRGDITILLGGG